MTLEEVVAAAGVPEDSIWTHLRSDADVHVLGVALVEATLEPVVVYDHDGVLFTRPVAEFKAKFRMV